MEYNRPMQNIAILLIGFSIYYILVLVLTHFKKENYQNRRVTHFMGLLLLLSLAGLQLAHFNYLQQNSEIIYSQLYLALLFLVAPGFYFYARPLLKAQNHFNPSQIIHFMPLLAVFIFSYKITFTLAFVVGSGYLLWLLISIYALRQHRDKFKAEMLLLSFVFVIAVVVAILALTMPIAEKLFFSLYASAVGLALLMVALVLSYAPKISETVLEVARETYAVSTLLSIDCQTKIAELKQLMTEDKLYQQNNLDLQTCATELNLSTHQLSELINTKLAKSFSRYLREQRVSAAQKLLISQPLASVLSIGLDVGFSSQSNFYDAFKEIASTTPGNYRKQNKVITVE